MMTFLIGMAWKSAAVAGAALLLLRLLRGAPAEARAALLRFAALLLLALPLLSLLLPPIEVALPREAAPAATQLAPMVPATQPIVVAAPAEEPIAPVNFVNLLSIIYVAGAALLLARLAIGVWRLNSLTRAAGRPECPRWVSAFATFGSRPGSARPARLLVSPEVAAPMSWGWRSPAILIDSASLARPEDAPAVIEHEMAHIDRGDWPALMLVRIAVALFWFNPLAWLLMRAFIQCAEEAADAKAIGRVDPADYAQMLLGYAKQGARPLLTANAMATHPVAARIDAILSGRLPSGAARWRVAAAMLACLAVAAPVAALTLARPESAAAPVPPVPVSVPAPAPAPAPAPLLARAVLQAVDAPDAPDAPAALDAPDFPAMPEPPLAPEPPLVDSEELDDSIERTVAHANDRWRAEVEKVKAHVASIDVEAIRRSAMRAAAEGMESGARGMEEGARAMAAEARQIRTDPEYRRRARGKWGRHWERLSDAEMIEKAREMEKGAAEMMKGAAEMRRKGAEMANRQR